MARYLGPRSKIVRRLEYPVFESTKFSSLRKNYPPGQHGTARRRKVSTYGLQLREKQRIKHLYGVLERQFRNYFKKATTQAGPTGHNLLIILEARLDNVIYRLGLAPTRRAARQIVSHKHVLVNDRSVNIPSYSVKPGDVVRIREKSRQLELVHQAMRRISSDNQLPWLELDKSQMTGIFKTTPQRNEIPEDVNEQLVVELYSK
ncbi:MAG: 30S ribosomal protein S4 [Candidatus Marinimicrobia bacterium]|nr:30S ribosomal protein S4 [Candidatus Neomarinimicrobiota bacterium]